MSGGGGGWRKPLGIGCLALLGVGLLAAGGALVFVRVTGDRDIRTLAQLNASLPDAATFTPEFDGGVAPARLERYLAVRDALAGGCAEFGEFAAAAAAVDGLANAEEEPAAGPFFRDAGRAIKGVFGVARRLGRRLETRNRALLAEGMGLGEFTWLQVVAYHGWLRKPATPFALARAGEPRILEDRVFAQARAMIRRLVAAHEKAGLPQADADPWRRELAALDADPARAPFADGVPPAVAATLEPYRARLEDLWCEATCEVDLSVTEHEGIGFEHR